MVKLDKKEITSLIQKVLDNNLSLLKMFVYESISYTCSDNEITIEYGYFGKISMYKTTITIKVLDNSTTVEYTCYGDCIKEEIKKDDNENYYSYIEKILDCIYSVIKKIRDKIINMEKELAKKIVLENIEELGLVADDVQIYLYLESPQ
ncbi:MAG TPA: hypothetical protein EYH22_00925, partial [Candidatus Nanopusillus sp.]|nr:hypothetical protein [Candidatus Nanopusillus sp.]